MIFKLQIKFVFLFVLIALASINAQEDSKEEKKEEKKDGSKIIFFNYFISFNYLPFCISHLAQMTN